MTKKIAFLFPGQGSQSVGMGKDLYDNFDIAKRVFDTADEVLEKKITRLCFEGPEDILKQTVNTQPCIVTMSIAVLESLKTQLNIEPSYVAGHSLGEYCAMYASGVMSLETTLKAIQKRADLMGATSSFPAGGMCAIINPPEEAVFKSCLRDASDVGYVEVANYNSPAQVVLTGEYDAVDKAGALMLERGARRAVMLPVSGAFHSKLMQQAGKRFEKFISDIELNDASIPVVTNVDAEPTTAGLDFKNKMPRQIYSSVRWQQSISRMIADGVDTFIEIGPGKVLAGLNKKINSEVTTYSIYDKASLDTVVEALKSELAGV